MIVWDEAKRKTNLEKHGLDFADANLVYENPSKITFQSPRKGEARKQDIAMVAVHDPRFPVRSAGLGSVCAFLLRKGA
jgi:uncharacterized DUF497 family protein